jgi:hypothetical protein
MMNVHKCSEQQYHVRVVVALTSPKKMQNDMIKVPVLLAIIVTSPCERG